MKLTIKLNDKDIRKAIARKYNVKASEVELIYETKQDEDGIITEGFAAKIEKQ